jgi:murein DD-endopeptidase MepM/ murein hydrolase activator NlpD
VTNRFERERGERAFETRLHWSVGGSLAVVVVAAGIMSHGETGRGTPEAEAAPMLALDLEAQASPLHQVMLTTAYAAPGGLGLDPALENVLGGNALADSLGDALEGGFRRTIEVKSGDTLMALLVDAGADRRDAHNAITALSDVFKPRDLRPGHAIEVAFADVVEQGSTEETAPPLLSFRLNPSVEESVEVVRQADASYQAASILKPLDQGARSARGEISSSLFEAARASGLPHAPLTKTIRAFSFEVDFQRDIKSGDRFDIFYESFTDESGVEIKTGEVLFAELVLSGTELRAYRYTPASGVTDYFNEEGKSVRRALLRTPIDGARMSSGFGMRKHPILGYSKMHKGVDFAAARGTPIYAAGDGVVEKAGRNGGYGNYIRLRHSGAYKTAYAHLKGFAKGVKSGARVRQGQVIGYVGSTGRSTGPHLHYEVLVSGRQVNPGSVKLPSGETLAGEDLKRFKGVMAEIDRRRSALVATQVAETQGCAVTGPAPSLKDLGETDLRDC